MSTLRRRVGAPGGSGLASRSASSPNLTAATRQAEARQAAGPAGLWSTTESSGTGGGNVACGKSNWALFSVPTVLASLPFVVFLAIDLCAENNPENTSTATQTLVYVLLLAVLVAPPLTHALAGWYASTADSYRLWQPFEGGLSFVLIQMVAWIAYGSSIILAFVFVFFVLGGSHTGTF